MNKYSVLFITTLLSLFCITSFAFEDEDEFKVSRKNWKSGDNRNIEKTSREKGSYIITSTLAEDSSQDISILKTREYSISYNSFDVVGKVRVALPIYILIYDPTSKQVRIEVKKDDSTIEDITNKLKEEGFDAEEFTDQGRNIFKPKMGTTISIENALEILKKIFDTPDDMINKFKKVALINRKN